MSKARMQRKARKEISVRSVRVPWSSSVKGAYRFLDREWILAIAEPEDVSRAMRWARLAGLRRVG